VFGRTFLRAIAVAAEQLSELVSTVVHVSFWQSFSLLFFPTDQWV
jgi:hypothetical protein